MSFLSPSFSHKLINVDHFSLAINKLVYSNPQTNKFPSCKHQNHSSLHCISQYESDSDSSKDFPKKSNLSSAIRRKQLMIQSRLQNMKAGELEESLDNLSSLPNHDLYQLIFEQNMKGKTVLLMETSRLSPSESSYTLTERCKKYVSWGVEGLVICCNEEFTSDGFNDIYTLAKSINVPIIQKDWIIHPLQIYDALKSGSCCLNLVYSVLGKGLFPILRFGNKYKLDQIVEIVNLKEMEEVETFGIPIFGINISVGLSLSLPGFRQSIAKSLIEKMPFGAISIAGVQSIEEARAMREAGANAIILKNEIMHECSDDDLKKLIIDLNYALMDED